MLHAPVGSFEPNAFGLHDVIGNLMELCHDGHEQDAYDRSWAVGDGALDTKPFDGHTGRGGAWSNVADMARSACRINVRVDMRTFDVGLRPVRRIFRDAATK